jgi:hypothetical protein
MPTLDLAKYVGKNINAICGNGFHDPAINHCAHFVSHVLELEFDLNCHGMSGGSKPAGNIRVQEIFPHCPKVGRWQDADKSKTQLIFVTKAANVDLAKKTMVNIPRKHVGIYHQGQVYHYGNTADKVTVDTPESFKTKFDGTYGSGQGYFFGWIPGEDLLLNVEVDAAKATAGRKFDLTNAGGVWHAREASDGVKFLVGREVNQASKKFHGINVPVADYWGPEFKAEDYVEAFDHWACLLEVTGFCESKNRLVLVNTYDRAKFTFGFYQLAAHTPRDNLILLFRELAGLPAFKDYFPELKIKDGRLSRVDTNGGVTDLETEMPTGPDGELNLQLFMNYLNPNRKLIDEQEVLHAARLIHWTVNDPKARAAQVRVSADILQTKMAQRHHPKLGLDGRSDVTCAILCDMLHQGRVMYSELRTMLQASNPNEALLTFKDGDYRSRNKALRAAVDRSIGQGKLGTRRYSAAANEFVPN